MIAGASAWFIGEGSLLVQAASIWLESGHSIAGIASRDTAIRAWAEDHGVSPVRPEELAARAKTTPFDYLFSVVNLTLLGDDVLKLPRKLAVNFHDGYLPRHAGVNVTVWALLAGETQHGVTWHQMTTRADEGDILVQQAFDVSEDETAFSLNARCFTAGIETFRELTERITSSTLAPTPQNLAERTYHGFYERPPGAMLLSFAADAETIARTVRALDFGTYPNPVGLPKVLLGDVAVVVGEAETAESSGFAPGTVLEVDERAFTVAVAGGAVRLGRLRLLEGAGVDAARLAELGVRVGARLGIPEATTLERLGKAYAEAAGSEGSFVRLLASTKPLALALGQPAGGEGTERASVRIPAGVDAALLPELFLAFVGRKSGQRGFDVGYSDARLRAKASVCPAIFSNEVPLRVSLDFGDKLANCLESLQSARAKASALFPRMRDLPLRQPQVAHGPFPVTLWVDAEGADERPEGDLRVLVDSRTGQVTFVARSDRTNAAALARLARRFELFLVGAQDHERSLASVELVSDDEKRLLLGDVNGTARPVPENDCVHWGFEAEARKAPERIAVTSRGKSMSYGELDRRANALARRLVELGVGPDVLVGIYLERGVDLVTAVLGVHKAGGAYVPLDPRYPAERIRFMVDDSKLRVVVAERATEASLPAGTFERVTIDSGAFDAGADTPPETGVSGANLAYVIYTSGSTGTPKGVMVEHRNVVNFLCGMDDVLGPPDGGTWLAVTSLSFDISVLELYWPLTRALTVVVHAGDASKAPPPRPLDFSVFYFSSAEAGGGSDHYRILFEGARFADENGFVAVWTPERHFHAFGGLYPNPAVTSAALAMVTKNVSLRAGSCVSPLHSPLRIAEEWALVDNLSNGRVGISFASGWQPNDFAIRPESFVGRREQMVEDIETVRRLWRGERLPFKNGNAKDVVLGTLPRPIQKEVPVWVTAAGTVETFEMAGRIGANLLTHLLGQTFKEVGDKVAVYRAAWEKAGHPGRGTVTLMLHTFIGTDEESVKATVRGPMKEYLKSAVGLIKEAAWSFPTFKQRMDEGTFSTESLSAEEMDALLEHAFDRYYATSGLFGTVDGALRITDDVRRLDVDEIACLIDFGVSTDEVLAHLPLLGDVVARSRRVSGDGAHGETVGDLLTAHAITHFQCTPSQASLLMQDERARNGLSRVTVMLTGGEALPPALARELRSVVPGLFVNVYGPTETTVWSSSHRLDEVRDDVPLGRAMTNTDILILDEAGGLVPPGDAGELVIGGKGVTRGYLGREELTRERFVPHPFRPGERLYRTGDIASFGADGLLYFHGRKDHQVKIRGYRIEVGEIEARLGEHARVRACAVIAREDVPGDKRLVAYVVARGAEPGPAELRTHLLASLPEYMVPSTFVYLPALPETPNGKIDRQALPMPERQSVAPSAASVAPQGSTEETIAAIWREVLNRKDVGVTDNFFDIGGHSLLTILVLGKLKPKVPRPLSLVDLFRYTTIRALADFLDSEEAPASSLGGSAARGAARQRIRRAMVERRRRN
jgi:natural product biosynthesis luciferase-like monooxygenase protein